MHEKLQVNFQELKRIYLINIKKKNTVHVICVRCSTKEEKPANRLASSVTLNDALKRDSSPLGHAVRKHRHATHASVLWVMMGHQVIDVCIFVQEKNNYFSKDSNENIV